MHANKMMWIATLLVVCFYFSFATWLNVGRMGGRRKVLTICFYGRSQLPLLSTWQQYSFKASMCRTRRTREEHLNKQSARCVLKQLFLSSHSVTSPPKKTKKKQSKQQKTTKSSRLTCASLDSQCANPPAIFAAIGDRSKLTSCLGSLPRHAPYTTRESKGQRTPNRIMRIARKPPRQHVFSSPPPEPRRKKAKIAKWQ